MPRLAAERLALDLKGKNVVNPIATILSGAMMLKYSFSLEEESNLIEAAVKSVHTCQD